MLGTRSGLDYQSPYDRKPFDAFWESFRNCIVCNNAVMWRSVYFEFGGFDSRIRVASDYDFWLRVSQKYRFVSTAEVTSNYRWHRTQISSAPDGQLRSVYETRYRFLQDTRQGGDEELACLMEKEEMLAIWARDIRNAWRDPEQLRVLLTLRALVPGTTPLVPGIWMRSRVPAQVLKRLAHVRMRLALRTRLARVTRLSRLRG